MHWRVQLKAVDPSASSPGDGWREIRHPVQGGWRISYYLCGGFYISEVVQMLFFINGITLKCSTLFHVKRIQMAWHLAEEGDSAFNRWVAICHWWPHITTACLKMTYHNLLPDLPKPQLLKMLCAVFLGSLETWIPSIQAYKHHPKSHLPDVSFEQL